jgi:serine protease Do
MAEHRTRRSLLAAGGTGSRATGWAGLLVKLVALGVGGAFGLLIATSLLGLFIDAGWARVLVAVVLVVGVPLLVVDRLLPVDGSSRPGLVTDVVALMWMAVAAAVVALGPSALRPPLEQQAVRFDEAGWRRAAWVTRWVAGVPTPELVQTEALVPATVGTSTTETQPSKPAAGAEFTPAPAQAQREVLTPAALFKAWAPSVVTLEVELARGRAVGTAFIIDARGTIVTNYHVVDDAIRIEAKLFDGTRADGVELLEGNEADDLAVLRIEADALPPPVVLGSSEAVEVGERVVVIGNPIGLEHTMTDGMISARRMFEGKKYIQMSAPVSPGNSGGPVFNQHGDVIGVTVAKLWGENLNLAIPIDVLKPMIKPEYPAARELGSSRW